MIAALFLELVFVIYIQNIKDAVEIVKNFIAIQVVATLDDFTGQMLASNIRRYRNINFSLEDLVKDIEVTS